MCDQRMRKLCAACDALPMTAQAVVEPKGRFPRCWIREIVEVLNSIFKNIKLVNVSKAGPSLGPNTFSSEIAVRIWELMPKMWHMLVRVLGAVVIKTAWVSWGV